MEEPSAVAPPQTVGELSSDSETEGAAHVVSGAITYWQRLSLAKTIHLSLASNLLSLKIWIATHTLYARDDGLL